MKNILAYIIFADEYERLMTLSENYKNLVNLLEANDPQFVTAAMIANAEGLKKYDVFNRPWLLPNFGKCDSLEKGRRKRFWRYDEYLDWVAIPEEERRKQYKEMTA